MSLVEDTLGLSSSSSNTHGTSALLSQKLDQAQEALQNFIQTRAPNSIRQSTLLGFLSNPNAPKVFIWTVVKLIQILSVIYLYYLIAPFPYTPVESSEPTQETVQSLTLSIVGFYVLLGAAVGWLLLNQLAKPSLGGIPTKRDQEVSSQAPGGLLMRLLLHSAWTAVGFYIWLMALQILAPTRVAILEYIEYFVAIVMGGLLKWKNSRPVQFENVGLLLGALFLFSLSITSEQANFTRYELIFQINTIRFDGILSHAWGIVLLLAAIVCNLLRKNHARRLSADLGSVRLLGIQLGGRRLFWASLACGGALLLPMIFINFVIVCACFIH
jgi:drug/metabolite transporter (DMT)-like permease